MKSFLLPVVYLFAVSAASAAIEYSVVDLGPGEANDINSAGIVVGTGPDGAFRYDGNKREVIRFQYRYFEDPAGTERSGIPAAANGINDSGWIVGSLILNPPVSDANGFRWDGSGIALTYPTLGSIAINANGDFLASESVIDSQMISRTSLIKADGKIEPFQSQEAMALNDHGIVVGTAYFPDWGMRAFRWTGGIFEMLPLSQFIPPGLGSSSRASVINSSGKIAGSYYNNSAIYFFRIDGATATTLSLGPFVNGHVFDMDSNGNVVGRVYRTNGNGTGGGQDRAFIYKNDILIDLNTVIPNAGWNLWEARGINDSGRIVGRGDLNGQPRAFLLVPINPGGPTPPSVVVQPQGGQFGLGERVSLRVSAIGTGPLSYQWQHNQVDLKNASLDTLTFPSINGTNAGNYRVVVTNALGQAFSEEAVITVLDPELSPHLLASLLITGETGGIYRIDWRFQLQQADWHPLATLTLTNSPQWFVDYSSMTNTQRVYRAVRLP